MTCPAAAAPAAHQPREPVPEPLPVHQLLVAVLCDPGCDALDVRLLRQLRLALTAPRQRTTASTASTSRPGHALPAVADVAGALLQAARTTSWPDGSPLLDLDDDVLRGRLAPALALALAAAPPCSTSVDEDGR